MEAARASVSLGPTGFRAVADVRGHVAVLDEPEALGGTNEGPSPVESLLSALGACTAMTLRMYADRKGWPLKEIRVEVAHHQLARAECLDCAPDAEFPQVDRIQRDITVAGDLDDEQLARLLDIANRCPVHRILTRHAAVVSAIGR